MTISTRDLARMRAAQESMLPGTCTVRRLADAQTWTTGTSVACRVAPMAAEQVRQYADRLGASSGWVITLPYGTVCTPGDRIDANGYDYDVLGTNDGESWQTALRVYCGRTR